MYKKLLAILLILLITLTGCITKPEKAEISVSGEEWFSAVGEFSGEPYVEVNGNMPFLT